ncbi:MAG: HDIG domain-containing protein [Lentisphaeria bacterium]|nr:HDIG domain-containing protein [Lentisphaeria bacterium]
MTAQASSIPAGKPKTFKEKSREYFRNSKLIRIVLFLILIAACFSAVIVPADIYRYREGQIIQKQIKAEHNFSWTDSAKTEAKRLQKLSSLPFFYSLNPRKDELLRKYITSFFDAVRKKNSLPEEAQKDFQLQSDLPLPLRELLNRLQSRSLVHAASMHAWQDVMERTLAQGIVSQERKNAFRWDKKVSVKGRNGRTHQIQARDLNTPEEALTEIFLAGLRKVPSSEMLSGENRRDLAKTLAKVFAEVWKEGNLEEDIQATEQARNEVNSSIKPEEEYVKAGDTIFAEKQKLSASDVEKYQTYRKVLLAKDMIPANVISNLVKMVMLLFVITLCIWSTRKELLLSNTNLSLLVLIAVTSVLLNKYTVTAFVFLADSLNCITPVMIYFSLPVGFGVILASAFFGTRTALFAGFFISVVASMYLPEPYKVMFAGCFITSVAASSVRGAGNYRDFFTRAFFGCTLAAFTVALAYFLHDENQLLSMVKEYFATGEKTGLIQLTGLIILPVCSGLFTAILGLLFIFLLELIFDVCTSMYLQLYSDLNYPLMRRMQLEAPGTYHHSLMVSTIAEQAARAIGADHILVRACALYHDIGKLAQPAYFIENSNGVNMHAGVAPSMSAMIILNHVKYGLELATKHKLKKPLREAIAQHHGDNFVVFFYKLAEAEAKRENKNVDAADFRYSGPKPSSKEIGILMLSDCCEAASRSLKDASAETVEQLVTNIINGKMKDGQLEDSFLSMRELGMIRKSITKTLISMSHIRIAYPKDNKEEKNEDDLFVAAGKNSL